MLYATHYTCIDKVLSYALNCTLGCMLYSTSFEVYTHVNTYFDVLPFAFYVSTCIFYYLNVQLFFTYIHIRVFYIARLYHVS